MSLWGLTIHNKIKDYPFHIFKTRFSKRSKYEKLPVSNDGSLHSDFDLNMYLISEYSNKNFLKRRPFRKIRKNRYLRIERAKLRKKIGWYAAKKFWIPLPYNQIKKAYPYNIHVRIIFLWYLKYIDIYINYYFEILFNLWLSYFLINSDKISNFFFRFNIKNIHNYIYNFNYSSPCNYLLLFNSRSFLKIPFYGIKFNIKFNFNLFDVGLSFGANNYMKALSLLDYDSLYNQLIIDDQQPIPNYPGFFNIEHNWSGLEKAHKLKYNEKDVLNYILLSYIIEFENIYNYNIADFENNYYNIFKASNISVSLINLINI